MSREESQRVMKTLTDVVYNEQYVYTHDWQDGQIVFMDQEITLHKRPTKVEDGDLRTMARVITYLDTLYPNIKPATTVRYMGAEYTHDEFARLVDQDRKQRFLNEQQNSYLTDWDQVVAH
jgi:hypothetical protein